MNLRKVCKTIAAAAVLSSLYASVSFADSSFIDLKFAIGQDTYKSMGVDKKLSAAPIIQNERTLVPLRAVLEEMGFHLEWDSKTRTITCTEGSKKVKLKIDSDTAYINGKTTKLDTSPIIVEGTTLVPLRFIAENFGATVTWDGSTKGIHVEKSSPFDTGSILMFDSSQSNNFYLYNGQNLVQNPMPKNYTFKKSYNLNNSVLVTATNDKTGNDNLLYLVDQSFAVAKENFEVTDVVKYGNSLIINGRNQITNNYELLKFDGFNVVTVASDFMAAKYIQYNGKLIFNKYDSYRDYYLISYDGANFTQINKGYAVNDFKILADNKLYMTGTKSLGQEKYLSRYDFTNFTDLYIAGSQSSYTLPFEIVQLMTSKTGQLYAFNSGTLFEITGMSMNEVVFYIGGRSVKIRISDIFPLNGSLLLNVNDVSEVLTRSSETNELVSDSDYTDTARDTVKGLMLFDSTSNWFLIYRKADFSKVEIRDNKVIAIGKDHNSTSENDILLVYDSKIPQYLVTGSPNSGNPAIVYDVRSLDKVLDLNGELVMGVQDYNRATEEEGSKILKYSGSVYGSYRIGKVSDLLAGFSIDSIEKSGSTLLIKANDTKNQKTNIYSYNGSLTSIRNSVEVGFWQAIGNNVFLSLKNTTTDKMDFFVFNNGTLNTISKAMSPEKVFKLKNNYYLVYARDEYIGNSFVYIYNSSSNKLYTMKSDFNLQEAMVSE